MCATAKKSTHNFAARYTGTIPAHRITPEGYKRGVEVQFDPSRINAAQVAVLYPNFKLGEQYIVISIFKPKANKKDFTEVTLRDGDGDVYGYVASHHLKKWGSKDQGPMKGADPAFPTQPPALPAEVPFDEEAIRADERRIIAEENARLGRQPKGELPGNGSDETGHMTSNDNEFEPPAEVYVPKKGDQVSVSTTVEPYETVTGTIASYGAKWLILVGSTKQYPVDAITVTKLGA